MMREPRKCPLTTIESCSRSLPPADRDVRCGLETTAVLQRPYVVRFAWRADDQLLHFQCYVPGAASERALRSYARTVSALHRRVAPMEQASSRRVSPHNSALLSNSNPKKLMTKVIVMQELIGIFPHEVTCRQGGNKFWRCSL